MSELSIRVAAGLAAEVRVLVRRVPGNERERAAELAVRLAAEVAGVAPDRLRLDHEPDGRPVVRGARVEVSVSHGRGVIAAAASATAPVGVDVEVLRPLPVEMLARRWLRPDETEWIDRRAPAERSAAFLWLWTQKEAVGKAAGRGLAGGSGLLAAVPLPACWPPPGGLFGNERPELSAVPGRADLAITAGLRAGLAVALAVAIPVPTAAHQQAGVGADQSSDTA
ncbi:MAG TPA: 4'-phosphopantetheinyl transferase superfamily protein [Actinocrinis sp.]|nr:4'-phosphopantetheinyl transferase superfamily protein [Actinocrinis sp.]